MGIGTIIFAISTAYQVVTYKKQRRKAEREAEKRRGFFLPIRGEASALPVVYGKQIIGGVEVNHKTFSNVFPAANNGDQLLENGVDFTTGTHDAGKNSYLIFNSALCNTEGTRIEGVQEILVDGTSYGYNKKGFKHQFRIHNSGGTADALCTANGFPSTNYFTNCAYATNGFFLNRTEAQYSGIPQLQYIIKGNHIRGFLFQGDGSYNLTSRRYSNSRVEVLFDYLTAPYGANIPEDKIDITSFGYASGIAATVAMTNQEFGGSVNGVGPLREYTNFAGFPSAQSLEDQDYFGYGAGVTVYKDVSTGTLYNFNINTKSYDVTTAPLQDVYRSEGNLTLDPKKTIRENINVILDGIPFADLVWTSEGKYRLIMEYPEDQTALDALISSDNTFGDDDILRASPINEGFGSASQRFNRVTVSFENEFENFASDSISWPARGSAVHTAYLAEDNDKVYESQIESTATTPYHAMAEAEHTVRQSRDAGSLEILLGRRALKLEPGDLFKIDSTITDAPNGIWKAEEVEIRTDFSVSIKSSFVTSNMFAWTVDDDIPYRSRPDFDFTVSKPTNLVASPDAEYQEGGFLNSYVDLTWDTEYDGPSFKIEFKKTTDSVWQQATSNTTAVRLPSLDAGKEYQVKVATVLSSGIASEFTDVITFDSGNDVTIPKIPQNLTAVSEATVVDLVWDAVTNNTDESTITDLVGYKVYRGLSANPTTVVGTEVGTKFTDSNRLANTQYNYRVRAYDSANNMSDYSSNVQVTTGDPAIAGITASAAYVTQGQITYDPNATSYSADHLDVDVTFRMAGTVTSKNRYRLARSGGSWAASVTDRSADIADEVNTGYISPSVVVDGVSATVKFEYDDTVSQSEISVPVAILVSGTDGGVGANGLNSATVTLFNKTATGASAPAGPSGTFTYTFATSVLSGGTLNGWSQLSPSVGQNEEMWVIRATASSNSSTDSVEHSEFSSPSVESIGGLDGLNNAIVTLFQKTSSISAPADPIGTLTYDFSTGNLSGTLNSWSQTAPTLDPGEYLQSIQATASSRTGTDTIEGTEFSSASIVGIGGADGLSVAVVTIYYASEDAPVASPSGTFTYTFSTGVLSGGTLNGWSQTPPSLGSGEKLWARQATASSNRSTDFISDSEFSGSVVVGQSGLSSSPVFLYQKTLTSNGAPSGPTGTFTYTFSTGVLSGGNLSSWAQTAPDITNGEKLWMSQATATGVGTTDEVSYSEFSSPAVIAIGGEDGDDGINNAIVTLYQKDSQGITPPPNVIGSFTYTFSTQSFTGGDFNGWSTSMPSMSEGDFLWTTQAAASAVGSTDTVTAADFSSPVVTSGVGSSGINSAIVFLYHKASSDTPPTSPSGTFLYDFSTGVLSVTTGSLNGWSQTPPSIGNGERMFQTQAVASNTSANDSIGSGEFSTPIINSIGGEDGVAGDTVITGVVYFHTLQVGQPTTPSASAYNASTQVFTGLTAGWGDNPPDVDATDTTLLLWSSKWTVTISGTDSSQTLSFNPATSVIQFPSTIQSDNFVQGSSGWRIERDGDVEFGAADIRGTLTASQIEVDGITISDLNNKIAIIENGVDMHNIRPGSLNLSGASTNNTPVSGATAVTAGSFTVGERYIIKSVGTTSFTSIGASSNTVGEEFHATGSGSGTGTAVPGFNLITSVDIDVAYDSDVRIAWNLGQDYPQNSGPLWGYQLKATDTDSGSFGAYFEAEADNASDTPVEFQGWVPSQDQYKVWYAYKEIFRRIPRQLGFDYWVGQLGGGTTEDQMRSNFIQSAEYDAMTRDFNRRVFLKGLNEAPGGTSTLAVNGGSIDPTYMESGKEYVIAKNVSSIVNFTSYGAPDEKVGTRFTATGGFPSGFVYLDRVYPLIAASDMKAGLKYCVYEEGSTDFTLYGAEHGDRGEIFTCDAVGSGTGLVVGVSTYTVYLEWMGENVGSDTIETVGALSLEGFSR